MTRPFETTRRVAHLSLVPKPTDIWQPAPVDLIEQLRADLRNHREPRIVAFFREHGDRCVWFVIGFAAACVVICALVGMGR